MRVSGVLRAQLISSILFGCLYVTHADEEIADDENVVDSNVLVLTEASFDDVITKNKNVLVKFYAPWCGHCKKIAPEFEKAASHLKSDSIVLGKVDATVESGLGAKYEIQGYPTLIWFSNGEKVEYDGGRDAEGIIEWCKSMTGPAFEELSEAPSPVVGKPVVTLSGNEKLAAFVTLAEKKRKAAKFVYTNSGQRKVTITHVEEDAISASVQDLATAQSLEAWFDKYSLPIFGALDGESFSKYMAASEGLVWVLPSISESSELVEAANKLRPIIKDIANAFVGKFKFTYTDTILFKQALEGMLGVSEFPKIAVQKKAGDKKKYIYSGDITDGPALKTFIESVDAGDVQPFLKSEPIPTNNVDAPVKVVVGLNMEKELYLPETDVLFEVYAPWCGHCKKIEPELEKVGKKILKEGVQNMIHIAKMDGTANDSALDVVDYSGFPTLFYFLAGDRAPVKYDGGRDAKAIWKWIKKNHSKSEELKKVLTEKQAKNAAGKAEEL